MVGNYPAGYRGGRFIATWRRRWWWWWWWWWCGGGRGALPWYYCKAVRARSCSSVPQPLRQLVCGAASRSTVVAVVVAMMVAVVTMNATHGCYHTRGLLTLVVGYAATSVVVLLGRPAITPTGGGAARQRAVVAVVVVMAMVAVTMAATHGRYRTWGLRTLVVVDVVVSYLSSG